MSEAKRRKEDEEEKVHSESDTNSSVAEDDKTTDPKVNKDGEQYWELGGKKRVTVRTWKGRKLIDIREFYGDDSKDLKPGKKGMIHARKTFSLTSSL